VTLPEAGSPEPVDVEFNGMAHGGEAVGRTADGMVVFASGGLPGERGRVDLLELSDRFARGFLASDPDPRSPDRVEARCPHYGAWPARGLEPDRWCGACQWQHVSYGAQLAYKTAILSDSLTRIGRLDAPNVLPAAGMEDPWAYRNHIRLVADGAHLGFRGVDGASIVPIHTCPIAHPLVEDLLSLAWEGLEPGVEVSLRCGTQTGDRMIVIHGGPEDLEAVEIEADASVALLDEDGTVHSVAGLPYLVEQLGGRTFQIPPDSFFQVNTAMAEELVRGVREALVEPGESRAPAKLIDLHSGVGTFAILCADLAGEVFAVERHPASVAAAVENAAGLENVTLVEASASEGLEYAGEGADAVIVDPPRSGLDRRTNRLLADLAPRTIVYISCDPSTLARDVGFLVKSGWVLESCRPVDMFPQSFHIESLNILRRT
jgi:23S rRNA (uracil1939-C5)-methyltransferase